MPSPEHGSAPGMPPDYLVVYGPHANCTLDLCPIAWSVYKYRPSLPGNIAFLVLFALAMATHVCLGVRWRSWWFMAWMIQGCFSEMIGYVGRIILYKNPFSFAGFIVQIIFITSGPVWYTGAIYVTLSKTIHHLETRLSRFKPDLFYWVFFPADIFCLILQAAGGALSSASSGASQTGVDLALAGLALQVAVIFIFCMFFADYMIRYMKDANTPALTGKVRSYLSFLALAIVLILGRCIYRCYELSKGYRDSDLITDEGLFMCLEGLVILVAVFCLCLGHPGRLFRQTSGVEVPDSASNTEGK